MPSLVRRILPYQPSTAKPASPVTPANQEVDQNTKSSKATDVEKPVLLPSTPTEAPEAGTSTVTIESGIPRVPGGVANLAPGVETRFHQVCSNSCLKKKVVLYERVKFGVSVNVTQ